MTHQPFNRRQALKAFGIGLGASLIKLPATAKAQTKTANPAFRYSLNMSTIRGHKLGFIKELQIAAKAGFTCVEIWIDILQAYLQGGGTVAEARRVIADLGLSIENAIGFAPWIVDDEAKRKAGLAQLQQEMELLAKIGCKRVAAPPVGANNVNAPLIDLNVIAERYRTILDMGKQTGVMPILEMWGGSPNLKKISQVLYVAAETGHPDARVLLDTFHIYKGGSSFDSVQLASRTAMDIIHINDYPAGILPAKISEPDRIYPGDGIAPLRPMLKTIRYPDRPIVLSLEVFNRTYYQQDPLLVAQTGLAKMKAVTEGL